jgi:diacylglycerol kinase family enzyme
VPDPVTIVANPFSGGGRAGRLARRVADRLRRRGRVVDLHETRFAGDARRRAAEAHGSAAIGCGGGDGTVNEVVNGLPETGAPPLFMIPGGTANVLAKELRLPRRAESLARLVEEGRAVAWDLGRERGSGRRFLLFAGAGYDAHVVHAFHAARRRPAGVAAGSFWNMARYVLWGLKSILGCPIPRIAVLLDGVPLTRDAAWVHVANVASYGGPLVFTPRARPDDGRFEVLVQHARRHRDILRLFWAALLARLFGRMPRMRDVTFHAARRVRLESADGRPVPVEVDGDPGGFLPAEFEILPGAVRILAPPTGRTARSSCAASSG